MLAWRRPPREGEISLVVLVDVTKQVQPGSNARGLASYMSIFPSHHGCWPIHCCALNPSRGLLTQGSQSHSERLSRRRLEPTHKWGRDEDKLPKTLIFRLMEWYFA